MCSPLIPWEPITERQSDAGQGADPLSNRKGNAERGVVL